MRPNRVQKSPKIFRLSRNIWEFIKNNLILLRELSCAEFYEESESENNFYFRQLFLKLLREFCDWTKNCTKKETLCS